MGEGGLLRKESSSRVGLDTYEGRTRCRDLFIVVDRAMRRAAVSRQLGKQAARQDCVGTYVRRHQCNKDC
jgi:hypothetical protein